MDSIAALRASHDRLAAIVAGLTPDQISAPAYPSEWSIAQVLSHLGSGAEITALTFDAGRSGAPAPGREANPPIWDRWNAKAPGDQVRDGVESDGELVARFESLDADQRATLRFVSFVGEVDTDQLARLRLSEHAVHTWDVAVALDPSATIGAEAVELVLDALGGVAGFSGKPQGVSTVVRVTTTDPGREFTLTLGPRVSLKSGADAGASAQLALPAEALIRLVYGRLDPSVTPPLTVTGVELDDLRRTFPGF
jgi:uncharacterized protein (TIGR03083 family)